MANPPSSIHPVPALTLPYEEGLQAGVVRYQVCNCCGQAQTLARYACFACQATTLQWQDACGLGTVRAVTEVIRAPSEEFKALAPYTLVLVELQEGFRLMAHGQAGVRIGQRVQCTFFTLAGRTLLQCIAHDSA
ncbi:Zn-ribbon domain-containing OB-fold protein [Lampropedia aestuarii]|uniref:Zn-ribbon domain-containing OB-fold protein n=1 Tax=Lampropedia aestuarii TaxID=2562762 RepID=UPI0024684A9C|nr:OB-fold domain-containing protein [Lampropedia aestuarii]MDH5858715.1 OB-fold domain-containing protein [Lampropedia aestuarii]